MKFIELHKVADISAGQSAPKNKSDFKKEGVPFIRAGSLENLLLGKNENELELVDEETIKKYRLKVYPKNTIVFAKSGMSATKNRIYQLKNDCCIVSHLAIVAPKDLINSDFLVYALRIRPASILINDLAYPSLSKKQIDKHKIPYEESIDSQKRIAQVLSNCESLIQKRKESIALLDELLKSTFLEMFGDPISNEKGWDFKTIKEHIGEVSTGNTPPRKDKDNFGDFIEWIKTNNIDRNEKYISTSREYLSKKGKGLGRIVQSNSLLVTCIAGSIKSIGNIGITNREVAFNQQINAITPNNDVDIEFLYWMFFISKNYLESKANKGMKKMISKSDFEKIKFPKPDFDLQLKFSEISKKVETIKQNYQTHLQELENLYGSISQKAFKGELDLSKVLLQETKYLSTYSDKTKDDFIDFAKKKGDEIEIKKVSIKDLLQSITNPKKKRDITNMTILDYYGVPKDLQNTRENAEFEIADWDIYAQFLLKDSFKDKKFTLEDIRNQFQSFFISSLNIDFDNEAWKKIIFKFLDAQPPLIKRFFDETDNTIKLKLTDEAFKA